MIVESLVRHLRITARGLRRTPGATLVAALTMALGIGATAAVFSLVDAAFLHELPYAGANRLVTLSTTRKGEDLSNSYPNFLDWRERNHTFMSIAAFAGTSVALASGNGNAELIRAQIITPDLFRTLGVPVARGRDFVDAEGQWGAPHVAIVGDGLWKRRFGGDPAIVGRTTARVRHCGRHG